MIGIINPCCGPCEVWLSKVIAGYEAIGLAESKLYHDEMGEANGVLCIGAPLAIFCDQEASNCKKSLARIHRHPGTQNILADAGPHTGGR